VTWSGGASSEWASGFLVDAVLWSTAAIVGVVLYLAGAAFSMRARNILRARRYSANEAIWEPILLNVIDETADVSELLTTVTSKSSRHFLRFLVRYARLLSGADRQVIVVIAAPLLPDIVGDLKSRKASKRALTVQTLATLGMDEHGADIAGALDDPSSLVSMVAARSLAGSSHPQYIHRVLSNLHRYSEWNSRFLSSMLASMGMDVAPALRNFLQADGNPVGRTVAADSLSMLMDPSAGLVAARVLTGLPDRELAAACLRLLRSVGGPEHLPVIRTYVSSRDFALRALSLRALGTIGDTSDLALLERGMSDSEPWVAINSAQALAEAGGRDRLGIIANTDHPTAALAREVLGEAVA